MRRFLCIEITDPNLSDADVASDLCSVVQGILPDGLQMASDNWIMHVEFSDHKSGTREWTQARITGRKDLATLLSEFHNLKGQ